MQVEALTDWLQAAVNAGQLPRAELSATRATMPAL